VVRIRARIDDVANGLWRDSFDRGDDTRGAGRRSGVDHDDSVLADLDADVAAGAGDHEEVRSDLQDLESGW
jgi:hypothetical protein